MIELLRKDLLPQLGARYTRAWRVPTMFPEVDERFCNIFQLTVVGTARYINSAVGRDRNFQPFIFLVVCMVRAAA